jgi:transposase InsO family protein
MPWKEVRYMEERLKFIAECLQGEEPMAQLCCRYGISRKCGYKWIARFEEGGPAALEDRSRAPKSHPNAVAAEVERAIVELRARKMRRGPLKLLVALEASHPHLALPAPSTVGDILKRHGLVAARPRRARPPVADAAGALPADLAANDVWCVDFKGWFHTGDGRRCDPLTISDAASRYLLRCQAMVGPTGFEAVRPLFEAAFRQWGLPAAIRSDNGSPFASSGLLGLSRLSVWWIRLGIRPDRIAPGKPQENGRHERLHRTLKEETLCPPAASARAQQRRFDAFAREYNEERPHQALGQKPPALFYTPSPRVFPERLVEAHYGDDWTRRRVRANGCFKWGGAGEIFLSQALVGESVGLEPRGDGLWAVHFHALRLGLLDERRRRVVGESKGSKQEEASE